ncbi:ABC transporter G family [Klebsormidium nitens]|uniref:ABC transporter G family n=1 Tax=Klebsormidium nitens TaxID=105231 RepID=A0A1Y1IG16_KLENI|nr:ABC transporter G family [Klebsormidium nitens]|eukprot:GAQ89785.1 ABC transporter G family [Klebsormidium nitens]
MAPALLLSCVLILLLCHVAQAQPQSAATPMSGAAPSDPLPPALRAKLDNVSLLVDNYIDLNYGFCIKSAAEEKPLTFDFNQDAQSILACDIEGRLGDRLCSDGELRSYFATDPRRSPPENVNCNADSYLVACNPGFASSLDAASATRNFTVPPKYPQDIPRRIDDYAPCCPGFFCPKGLACMIPCPIGAYCPSPGFLTEGSYTTCDPYEYSPPSKAIGCGGADTWGIAGQGDQIFCPEASYCPSPTEIRTCDAGRYCRKGSSASRRCSPFVTCDQGTGNQDLHFIGVAIIVILFLVLIVIYKCTDGLIKLHGKERQRRRLLASRALHKVASTALELSSGGSEKRRPVNTWQKVVTSSADTTASLLEQPGSPPTAEVRNEEDGYSPPEPSSPLRKASDPATRSIAIQLASGSPRAVAASPKAGASLALVSPVGDGDQSDEDESAASTLRSPWRKLPKGLPPEDYQYVFEQLAAQKRRDGEAQEPAAGASPAELAAQAASVSGRVPPIELDIRRLGLRLKKSGKMILQDVTARLRPGRVTAVMGPSGAGKTSFLTAVAGKETRCTVTGTVLINGREGSIQSYRKIVGFVPQDDIVHGNLTVAENLSFSASYRLPVGMARRNRVFAVERAIWALGLESIRDARVGTVEQRGISGGQRKRVNVGLEMVAEPSLLILDEPTSGLDSTSSRLVVQALRREAARGVNVGVVLHQPNYTLFRMFDDVMFLAKGGRVCYFGPVPHVEAYFDRLGFHVPDRTNPPDHYMDVLEGVIKPESSTSCTHEDLPRLWAERKSAPAEDSDLPISRSGSGLSESGMRNRKAERPNGTADRLNGTLDRPGGKADRRTGTADRAEEASSSGSEWNGDASDEIIILPEDTSLARVFLLKCSRKARRWARARQEELWEACHPAADYSGRRTPGFLRQYIVILKRTARQKFREPRVALQDYIILLITGAALGFLSTTNDDQMGGFSAHSNSILAVGLLCMIAALRTFSQDQLNYFREAASGINKTSYFLAKDAVDLVHVLLKPLFYLSLFYFFNNPRSTFEANYGITVAIAYCTTGVAYIFAIAMQPAAAQLSSAVFALVSVLLGSRRRPRSVVIRALYDLTYARWALEGYVVANAERYAGVWLLTRCAVLARMEYDLSNYVRCVFMLFLYGFLARCGALFCLHICHREKQR